MPRPREQGGQEPGLRSQARAAGGQNSRGDCFLTSYLLSGRARSPCRGREAKADKSLASVLKLELLEDRTAEEIAAIWSQHFVAKVTVVDKTNLVKVNVVPVPMVPNYYRNILTDKFVPN